MIFIKILPNKIVSVGTGRTIYNMGGYYLMWLFPIFVLFFVATRILRPTKK